MKLVKGLIIAAAALLGGCAITSMEAKIRPDTAIVEDLSGGGATVGVTVADERPSQDIGKRAAMGASIQLNEDLASIYQTALIDGLTRRGFDARPGAVNGAPELKVEIRALSYGVSTGWWTAGINVDSAVKAYVIGGVEPYERLYRSSDQDRAYFYPGAKTNNSKINEAVSMTLRQLLEDAKLIDILASATFKTTESVHE
jgi:uncharacterized lipoprotein YajG